MEQQPTTLPDELRLVSPSTLPQARSYVFPIPSVDQTYDIKNSSQPIQIDIPRLQRSYLSKDSYLSFTVSVTWQPGDNGGGSTATDGPKIAAFLETPGAFGLFDSIEVYDYLGSTLLERTNGHAELMSLLVDGDPTGYGPSYSIGTRNYGVCYPSNPPYYGSDPTVSGPFSGTVFPSDKQAVSTTQVTVSRDFSIPLASFLGFMSKKMAPLHNGYTVLLKWNSYLSAFGATDLLSVGFGVPTSFDAVSVSNVKYNAQILELGPLAESMLQMSLNGDPMMIHTKSYRNYTTIWPAGGTYVERTLDLNLNVASMTGLLWQMREDTKINKLANRNFQRIRNHLVNWSFVYGSSVLPNSSGIDTKSTEAASFASGTQAYQELMKALRAQGKLTNFNIDSWNVDSSTTSDSTTLCCPFLDITHGTDVLNQMAIGRFACGLNTQLTPGYDSISGLNTNGISTQIKARFSYNANKQTWPGTTNIVQANVDAWVEYDAFITVIPGISTSVTF